MLATDIANLFATIRTGEAEPTDFLVLADALAEAGRDEDATSMRRAARGHSRACALAYEGAARLSSWRRHRNAKPVRLTYRIVGNAPWYSAGNIYGILCEHNDYPNMASADWWRPRIYVGPQRHIVPTLVMSEPGRGTWMTGRTHRGRLSPHGETSLHLWCLTNGNQNLPRVLSVEELPQ
jgi:hypothetical protein